MKLQNAEMEFVAFDAEDVIATSGMLTDIAGTILAIRSWMRLPLI